MGKKNILITIVLLVIGGSVIYLIWFQDGSDKFIVYEKESLSQRANDYLEKKKQKEVEWRRLNFEKKEVDQSQILGEVSYQVGDCFAITIPFPVKFERQKGNCHQYFSIIEPRGQINAYQAETKIKKLAEDPGIKLRRKSGYDEKTENFNGREFTIFSKLEPGQEITAFNFSDGQLLVVSLTTDSKQSLEEEFKEMLKSVRNL